MDAICIGELLIDFTPEHAPNVYRRNPGGAPANVAVAMARTGLDVGFIGKVGSDAFGDFLLDVLRREGVRILCTARSDDTVTTMVFVSLCENGERSFTFVRKPGADILLAENDVRDEDLWQAKLLNAGSVSMSDEPARSATLYAMRRAREMGKLVCFDVNYRDMIWRGNREEAVRCIRQALGYVDLLKMSDEEVELLCGNRNLSSLLEEFAIHAIVVTHGADGAHCYMKDGVCQASGKPKHAVDTTGAGDAFWGNVLGSLLRDGIERADQIELTQMAEALRWGNSAGGYCVEHMGAIPGMPTLDDLRAALA